MSLILLQWQLFSSNAILGDDQDLHCITLHTTTTTLWVPPASHMADAATKRMVLRENSTLRVILRSVIAAVCNTSAKRSNTSSWRQHQQQKPAQSTTSWGREEDSLSCRLYSRTSVWWSLSPNTIKQPSINDQYFNMWHDRLSCPTVWYRLDST